MNRADLFRLHDTRDFARHAKNSAGGLSAEVLATATQPQHAALYALMVVGEALNKVSTEVKGAAPAIPWRTIIALRHTIVHGYWQIDLNIIADIVANRIDPFLAQLDALIAVVEKSEA